MSKSWKIHLEFFKTAPIRKSETILNSNGKTLKIIGQIFTVIYSTSKVSVTNFKIWIFH